MGNNQEKTDTTSVVWTQLSDESGWTELYPTDAEDACPRLENPSVIRYNGHLYAFGRTIDNEFSPLHESTDNGITWHTPDEKTIFPDEFGTLYEQSKGNYSFTTDENHFIWMIWSQTGEVWKGRINKLGFKKP